MPTEGHDEHRLELTCIADDIDEVRCLIEAA
jgi:hypothetical protein